MPQISVIVPIYKVEPYLQQCVQSVLNQTFSDLELILVDDGSRDRCPEMCDQYADYDSRVKVIHKGHSGLSEARNAGLSYVTSEFVYYLDSDDYIEPNAFELLLECQRRTNADIVFANYFYTYSANETVAQTIYQEEKILNNLEAMTALVNGEIQTFAWGKLIRTNIAKKYLFPKGKRFEDHYWTHFVIGDAEQVAVIPQALVHYRQRDNSISFTFNLNRLDMIEGWLSRKDFLEKNYPELVEPCIQQYAERYVEVSWLILTRMKKDKRTAFQKLREYNKQLKLQNHSVGETKKLICSLERGNAVYAICALCNRLRREK